jgi:hypothetical protein
MEIRHNDLIKGRGLFATKKYKKGEIIYKLCGTVYDYPTRETIHIGSNKHIYDQYGIFINHSFEPTIYIKDTDLIALKDINENDEIVFNYNENELEMANPFYVNGILVKGRL